MAHPDVTLKGILWSTASTSDRSTSIVASLRQYSVL
jgi:hypothetical protein